MHYIASNMNPLEIGALLALIAWIWAAVEVQIEGLFSLMGGSPTVVISGMPKGFNTLYHLLMPVLILLVVVLVFAIFNINMTWEIFGLILCFLVLIGLHKDYSWNIINPGKDYGWRAFVERSYPAINGVFVWHMPLQYFLMAGVSLILWGISMGEMRTGVGIFFTTFGISIILTVLLPKLFKKYMEEMEVVFKKHAISSLQWFGPEEYYIEVFRGNGRLVRTFSKKGISTKDRFAPDYLPKNIMEDDSIEL